MNNIVIGSLSAIAKQQNKSIAETFINADLVAIVDTSGSMISNDSQGGKTRYEVACEELAALQANHPGKIAVIAFSDDVIFCPSGVPFYFGNGTDMARALEFAKIADVPGMNFVLISDGEPKDEKKTLQVAQTYQNKISTIYVGPEDEPAGREFLRRLAASTGGKSANVEGAKELQVVIEKLYLLG